MSSSLELSQAPIPDVNWHAVTAGLAKRLNDGLMPHISGQFEPHQIAEILADHGVVPESALRQIIDDRCEDARRQAERMVPGVARTA